MIMPIVFSILTYFSYMYLVQLLRLFFKEILMLLIL